MANSSWPTVTLGTPRLKGNAVASPASSRPPEVVTPRRSLLGRNDDPDTRQGRECDDVIPLSRGKKSERCRPEQLRTVPRDPFALSSRNPEDVATSAGNSTRSQRGGRERNSSGIFALKRTESERERIAPTSRKLPGTSPRRSWSASSKAGRASHRDLFAPESTAADSGTTKKSNLSRHSMSTALRASPKDPISLQRQSSEASSRSPEDELNSGPAQPLFEAPRDPFATVVESPTKQCTVEFLDLQAAADAMVPMRPLDKTKKPGHAPVGAFPDLASPRCTRRHEGGDLTSNDNLPAAAGSFVSQGQENCQTASFRIQGGGPRRSGGLKKLQSFGARLKVFGGSRGCTSLEAQANKGHQDEADPDFSENSSNRTSSNTSTGTNSSISTRSTFSPLGPPSTDSSSEQSATNSRNGSYKEASGTHREHPEQVPGGTPMLPDALAADIPSGIESATVPLLPGKFPGACQNLEESPVRTQSECSPSPFADSASVSKWTPCGMPTLVDRNGCCVTPSPLGAGIDQAAACSQGAAGLPHHQALLILERRMARVVGGNSAALNALGFASQAEATHRFGELWSLLDICGSLKMEEWDEAASKVASGRAEFITLKLRLRDLNKHAPLSNSWVYLELHPGNSIPGTLSGTLLTGYLSPAPSVPTTSAAPTLLPSPAKEAFTASPQNAPSPGTPPQGSACVGHAPPSSPSVWRRFKGGVGALLPWNKVSHPRKKPTYGQAMPEDEAAKEVSTAEVRNCTTTQPRSMRSTIRRLSLDVRCPQGSSASRSSLDLPTSAEETFVDQNLGTSTVEGRKGTLLWFLPAVGRSVDLASVSSGEGFSNVRVSSSRRRSLDNPFSLKVSQKQGSQKAPRHKRSSVDIHTREAKVSHMAPAAQGTDRNEGATRVANQVLQLVSLQLNASCRSQDVPKLDDASAHPQGAMSAIAEGLENTAVPSAPSANSANSASNVIRVRRSLDLPSGQLTAERALPKERFQDLRVEVASSAGLGTGFLQSPSDADSARRSLDLPPGRDTFPQGVLQAGQHCWQPAELSNQTVTQESDISVLDADGVKEKMPVDGTMHNLSLFEAAVPGQCGAGRQVESYGQQQLASSASEADLDVLLDRRLSLDVPHTEKEGGEVAACQGAEVSQGHLAHGVMCAPRAGGGSESCTGLEDDLSMGSHSPDLPAVGALSGPNLPGGENESRPSPLQGTSTRVNNKSTGQRHSRDLLRSQSWNRLGAGTTRQGDMYPAGIWAHASSAGGVGRRSLDLPGDMWQGPGRETFSTTQGGIWGGKSAMPVNRLLTCCRSLDLPIFRESSFHGAPFTPQGSAEVHHCCDGSIPAGVDSVTRNNATANGVNSFSTLRLASRLDSLRRVVSQHHMPSSPGAAMPSAPPVAYPCHVPSFLPRASSMQHVHSRPRGSVAEEGLHLSLSSASSVTPLAQNSATMSPSPRLSRGSSIFAAVGRTSSSSPLLPHRPPLVPYSTGQISLEHTPPPAARGVFGRLHEPTRTVGALSGASSFGLPQKMRRAQSGGIERHNLGHSWRREGEVSLETSRSVPAYIIHLPGNMLWDGEQSNATAEVTMGLPQAGLAFPSAPAPPQYAPPSQQAPTRMGSAVPGGTLAEAVRGAGESLQVARSKDAFLRLLSLSSTESSDMGSHVISALALDTGSGFGFTRTPDDDDGILIISTPGRDLDEEEEEYSEERAGPASYGLLRVKSAGAFLERRGSEGEELSREKERVKKKVTWADNVGVPWRVKTKKKVAKDARGARGAKVTEKEDLSRERKSVAQGSVIGVEKNVKAEEGCPLAVGGWLQSVACQEC